MSKVRIRTRALKKNRQSILLDYISLDAVKSHVKNIFRKVGVSDKTELVYKLNRESDQAVV